MRDENATQSLQRYIKTAPSRQSGETNLGESWDSACTWTLQRWPSDDKVWGERSSWHYLV